MPFDWTLIPTIFRGLSTALKLMDNFGDSKDADRRLPRLSGEIDAVGVKLESLAETFDDFAEDMRFREREFDARLAVMRHQQETTEKQLAELHDKLARLQNLTKTLVRVAMVSAILVGGLTLYVLLHLASVLR